MCTSLQQANGDSLTAQRRVPVEEVRPEKDRRHTVPEVNKISLPTLSIYILAWHTGLFSSRRGLRMN